MLGGIGAGGEGDDRRWYRWMASLTRWTWVWVNSGSWWWTGRPGVLQFMGSQRVGHYWVTELNWTEIITMGLLLWAQTVKCLPTMQETRVWPLGQEDPLKKEMATHFSTLAWKIPWTEEPGRLQSMGSQRVGHNWETSLLQTITKGKAGLGVFEPLDTTSSPTNPYITLFSVCFCLKTPYLIHIVDSLAM